MKFPKSLLAILMLVILTIFLAVSAAVKVAPNLVGVASYWGYVVLTPGLIVAVVVCGWLMPRKE